MTTHPAIDRLLTTARRFVACRRGADAIEYGILAMMIAIALVGMSSLTGIAEKQSTAYNNISDALQ